MFDYNDLFTKNHENLNFTTNYDSYDYKYPFVFYFEKKYYATDYMLIKEDWMAKNWQWSIYYSIIYITLIQLGQRWMKTREKFHLYRSLIAWNIVLAIFSILGALRFLPNFVKILSQKGLTHSICVLDYHQGVSGCWTWLFILSKLVELVDTMFIVLRKQKLIFLHWYHHATVLIYCWYAVSGYSSTGRWFIAMNFSIHAIMYTYYAFRALRFSIPKFVNMIITSLQISQMVVGIFVNFTAFFVKNRNEPCSVSYENIYWSFFMYFTYFVLFGHFFINAYLKKPATSKRVHEITKELNLNGKLNSAIDATHLITKKVD